MNDLEQLKTLLFGAEKAALDSITERVGRREIRTTDVADVLPEAIHQSHARNGDLVDSLAAPVGQCVKQQLRDDPQTYSDALYPVIGPAIRKSIMHALRNVAQQINEAVEHSVSPRGLKWRWQASRAGIPFGEYVLQKTMRYRVEQAYLISRHKGLLIAHAHHDASRIKDSDAVSAMFTAIQDFVKESFSPDRSGRLESADMGEFTLWAMHGPHALLVCVIRGVPPKALRGDLSAILERIHFRYGDAIQHYNGDTSTVDGAEAELERCLKYEARDTEERASGRSVVLIVLLVLLAVVAAFLGYRDWRFAQQFGRLEALLAESPGIHVSAAERNGSDFSVRGLKDPLAADVWQLAEGVGVSRERLALDLQPFQSLDPAIVAQRAARMLGQPGGVSFDVAGSTLRVSGDAPWAWRAGVEDNFRALAGIDALDTSGLVSSDRTAYEQRIAGLGEKTFYFGEGTALLDDSRAELVRHVADLREVFEAAAGFGYTLEVAVSGSTDSFGDAQANAELARQRARVAIDALRAGGAATADIAPGVVTPAAEGEPRQDPSRRFVRIELLSRQIAVRE